MKRKQVRPDEKSYELLRRKRTLADLGFVGIGRSEQSDYAPVSERHDEALADAMYAEMQGKADEFSRRHGSG